MIGAALPIRSIPDCHAAVDAAQFRHLGIRSNVDRSADPEAEDILSRPLVTEHESEGAQPERSLRPYEVASHDGAARGVVGGCPAGKPVGGKEPLPVPTTAPLY